MKPRGIWDERLGWRWHVHLTMAVVCWFLMVGAAAHGYVISTWIIGVGMLGYLFNAAVQAHQEYNLKYEHPE